MTIFCLELYKEKNGNAKKKCFVSASVNQLIKPIAEFDALGMAKILERANVIGEARSTMILSPASGANESIRSHQRIISPDY